jgi:polyhydroxyalkanoate synthesis regulator phasin
MPELSGLFKSDVFWSALSALIAFAALLGTIGAAVNALLKSRMATRLQATLVHERTFYQEQARRVADELIKFPEESAIDRYLDSVKSGLVAIGELSKEQRRGAKDRIRELISQLRATHTTLVNALKPFTTNDAKKFFEGFDQLNQDFGALYKTGNIPHDARTHCSDVVAIVNDLVTKLGSDTMKTASDQIAKINAIAHSMEYADEEIIVPIMTHILSKTEVELSLINAAIRDGNKHKAIWLKERYRFDVDNLYKRLNEALTRMTDLASTL